MNILTVFTGGTIGSSAGADGYFAPDEKCGYRLLQLYGNKDPGGDVRFDTVQPYTTLSENLNGKHLSMLIHCVRGKLAEGYDGIIVTHGTDTLQYTASALGYALGNCPVPVILVSANYILTDARSNGLDNFAGAVEFIRQKQGTGVFAAYKNGSEGVTFHRGTRLSFHPPYADCLYSIENQYYGILEEGSFRINPVYNEREDETAVLTGCWGEGSSPVRWVLPCPGVRWPDLDEGCRAVLFGSYHSGTMGTDSREWKAFVNAAGERKIPLYLTGASDGASYESTKPFTEYGIRILPKASPIAMYIKLSMAVSQGLDPDAVMYRSLGGDLL